jgi:integrase
MRFKHVLNRAVEWGYLKSSPAARVKKLRDAPGRTRYLQPEERAALLAEAAPPLRAYILAALTTAARRGELVNLRWSAIDRRAGRVSFVETKNGDTRVIPLTRAFRELLDTLPRPLAPDAYVLPRYTPQALTVAFGRLARALKLPDLRFHDLRHDAASVLTAAGASQREVMEVLGHRDARAILRYQQLRPDHLRDVMRALDGAIFDAPNAKAPLSTGTITAPATGTTAKG